MQIVDGRTPKTKPVVRVSVESKKKGRMLVGMRIRLARLGAERGEKKKSRPILGNEIDGREKEGKRSSTGYEKKQRCQIWEGGGIAKEYEQVIRRCNDTKPGGVWPAERTIRAEQFPLRVTFWGHLCPLEENVPIDPGA